MFLAQLIGFIAFLISLTAYHKGKKSSILGSMVISHCLNLIHYFLIGAYTGFITKVLSLLRDSFIVIKDKFKIPSNLIFVIFILLYIIVGFYMYTSILSIFPIIASLIYIFPVWNGNTLTVRKTAFFCYFLWLTYNIYVRSISGILSNVLSVASVFIAIHNSKSNN